MPTVVTSTQFQDLVTEILNQVDAVAAKVHLRELSAKEHEAHKRHIRNLCGQILNRGRVIGWDEHAAIVRDALAAASATNEEFRNMPLPEDEGF